MTESQFKQQKAMHIADVENRMEMVSNGDMMKSLELELMIAKRRTFEHVGKDRRFITN